LGAESTVKAKKAVKAVAAQKSVGKQTGPLK
jgi:hypothetical protein